MKNIKPLIRYVKKLEENNNIERECILTGVFWLDDEILFCLTDDMSEENFMRYMRSLNV